MPTPKKKPTKRATPAARKPSGTRRSPTKRTTAAPKRATAAKRTSTSKSASRAPARRADSPARAAASRAAEAARLAAEREQRKTRRAPAPRRRYEEEPEDVYEEDLEEEEEDLDEDELEDEDASDDEYEEDGYDDDDGEGDDDDVYEEAAEDPQEEPPRRVRTVAAAVPAPANVPSERVAPDAPAVARGPVVLGASDAQPGPATAGPPAATVADGGSRPPGVLPPMGGDDRPPPPAEIDQRSERPVDEGLVAAAAVVLAASVFFPWYSGRFGQGVSGWTSGTWGPIIFCLSVAAVLIVGMRIAGIPVAFPLGAPLILEGIGWVAVLGVILKRWFPAGNDPQGAIWVSLVAAFGVALLAGRVSKDTPIVVLPGWHKGRAGTLGAVILVGALGAGLAFGFVNEPGDTFSQGTGGPLDQVKGFPSCAVAAGFPLPKGITATDGINDEQTCTAVLTSKLSLAKAFSRYRAALTDAGWKFTVPPSNRAARKQSRSLILTEPSCGGITMAKQPTAQPNGKTSNKLSIVAFLRPECPTVPGG